MHLANLSTVWVKDYRFVFTQLPALFKESAGLLLPPLAIKDEGTVIHHLG